MLSVPLIIDGNQIGDMQITRLQPLDHNREWYDYEWVAHFPPVRGVGRASGRILHRRIDTAWVLVQKAFTAMCGDLPEGWNEPASALNLDDPRHDANVVPTEVRECICGREFEVVVQYAKPWTVCPHCMVNGGYGPEPKP